jgi:nitrogen fixation NifU-like protein
MSAFYNAKVIDHFNHPRNVGVIKNADAVGYVGHPSLGMDAELYLKIENGLIIEAKSKSLAAAPRLL